MLQDKEAELGKIMISIDQMREVLRKQIRLVDLQISVVHSKKIVTPQEICELDISNTMSSVQALMMQGMGSSCNTLLNLSKTIELQIRDCFIIARAIVESAINVSFIFASGDHAAEKAERHALQKTVRDFDRTSEIGGVIFKVGIRDVLAPEEIPGAMEALKEFTTRKGREKTQWTDENLVQKIEKISSEFPGWPATGLHAALLMVFRHSSELIHGTYFGSLFFLGQSGGGHSQESPINARIGLGNHLLGILCTVIMVNNVISYVVSKKYDLPSIKEAADEIFVEFEKVPILREGLGK